ncbi:YdeI/OmpD-associated family protein [Silvibacterium acidisoli]|uniref:YdeI/OmpD-associated family protein n=1 Tax=Acidobacteriaceae bacterium ZG23-2 TaxID=2883246 RepID=UPI00406C47FE
MKKSESLPTLTFKSSRELQTYMSGQPRAAEGFWLKLSKAGAPEATISRDEAIDTALCCGWIDGQLAKFDDSYFLIRMTPRRAGSRWSAKNRAAVDRLAGLNRLLPAGIDEINAAKEDGRWDAAYASQGKAEPPQDLLAALRSNKAALRFFEGLDRANRYSIIYRVGEAKRPETRANRIAKFVAMLERGETIHRSKKKA